MPIFAFEDFEIDLDRFELRPDGELVPIGPRAFEVLSYLIRHRDRAVSKRELIAKVWGVVALGAAAVPTCVTEIRRALGDSAGSQRFIVTLPRAPEDRGRAESLFAEARSTADRLELGGLQSKLSALQAEFVLEPAVAS